LPGVREAPITAIDLGYKRNSSIIQNTTKLVIGNRVSHAVHYHLTNFQLPMQAEHFDLFFILLAILIQLYNNRPQYDGFSEEKTISNNCIYRQFR
jgi:hypothetical protein